ncbi:hypothetical protein M3147_05515 [Agromyces mediolanus]|uniref:hypothetical protein n=1 Tax=Agromyces mediolanus TaxID=41986 RepID=UPI0020406D28|nr:hypothetical protein [Agromyces mediolanus]MCM3656708.1 hypothetical protein [Agromyces mediolanus]
MAGRRGASDERGRLIDDPFARRAAASGRRLVSRGGRRVMSVAGPGAARFLARPERAEADDDLVVQHLPARATGTSRRGGEQRSGG